MGRKTKYKEGIELGFRWPTVLRMDKMFKEGKIQGDYKKMFREQIKRKIPNRKYKINRQEFEDGFRLGLKKAKGVK